MAATQAGQQAVKAGKPVAARWKVDDEQGRASNRYANSSQISGKALGFASIDLTTREGVALEGFKP